MQHRKECEPCQGRDREEERRAMDSVIAMVTSVPLDDWPSEVREEPKFRSAYRYMDVEELFQLGKEEAHD
ncbi:MAG: hypothetical protein Q7R73_03110 [bacterium]|nr:hypothetical protein [bacterium]